jgi:hypothetical protein
MVRQKLSLSLMGNWIGGRERSEQGWRHLARVASARFFFILPDWTTSLLLLATITNHEKKHFSTLYSCFHRIFSSYFSGFGISPSRHLARAPGPSN